MRKNTKELFHAKYVRVGPDDCWLWTASRDACGYGQFRFAGKLNQAHRIAWALKNGPIPPTMLICHHCDTPACVNPAHLFLGTHADNMEDRKTKGRNLLSSGENNGQARLTVDQVLYIRAMPPMITQASIARLFEVRESTISRIKNGKIWKHV